MIHSEVLYRARKQKRTLGAGDWQGGLTVEEAYLVQNEGLKLAEAEGEKLVGYKMGLTSRAKQEDVKVFSPIRGFLLASMQLRQGEVHADRFVQPRVEPEIAVVLDQRVRGAVSTTDLIPALRFYGPALEILDSRFQAFQFSLSDVIADNTSAAGFIVGTRNAAARWEAVRLWGISLWKNGELVETGAAAAALGDPLRSVSALALDLEKEGKWIEPGQVILTGGTTASVSFQKGDKISARFPGETLAFDAV